jgi:hypothetical protein
MNKMMKDFTALQSSVKRIEKNEATMLAAHAKHNTAIDNFDYRLKLKLDIDSFETQIREKA